MIPTMTTTSWLSLHRLRSRLLSHFSPPASVRWVCLAGAGSGRTRLLLPPLDPKHLIDFGETAAREAVFLLHMLQRVSLFMALNVICRNATIPSLSAEKRTRRDLSESGAHDRFC